MQKCADSRKPQVGWFSKLTSQAQTVVPREANQSHLSEFGVITLELPVSRQFTQQTIRQRLQMQADESRPLLAYNAATFRDHFSIQISRVKNPRRRKDRLSLNVGKELPILAA